MQEQPKYNPDTQPDMPSNVFEMETTDAKWRIIYENHLGPTIDPSPLQEADGYCNETPTFFKESLSGKPNQIHYEKTVADQYQFDALGEIYQGKGTQIARQRPRQQLFLSAIKNKIPIFYIDVISDSRGKKILDFDDFIKNILLLNGEAILSAIMVKKLYNRAHGTISRRKFLKILGYGTGVYGLSTLPFSIQQTIDKSHNRIGNEHPNEQSQSRKREKSLRMATKNFHYEIQTLIHDGRDAVFAAKSELAAKILHQEQGKKPLMAISVGANHHGIEQTLQMPPEKRAKIIHRFFKNVPYENTTPYLTRVEIEDSELEKAEKMQQITAIFRENPSAVEEIAQLIPDDITLLIPRVTIILYQLSPDMSRILNKTDYSDTVFEKTKKMYEKLAQEVEKQTRDVK